MTNIAIVSALRTAIGKYKGSYKHVVASDLGAQVIQEVVRQSRIDPSKISEVIMGQAIVANQGQNTARQAAIHAGLPVEIPATTISKVCGSGLYSVILGVQAIRNGDAELVIAGGQENMSASGDALYTDGLTDAFSDEHMAVLVENQLTSYGITREDQDEFAYMSQQKAIQAWREGRFLDEVVGSLTKDEQVRPSTNIELLKKLAPAFKEGGTITAGNAPGINDGAAAVLLVPEARARELGLPILATINSYAQVATDPKLMGTAPVKAVRSCLAKSGWTLDDLDLIEANEAFAAQSLMVNKELGWDTSKINVNGGAIALGHPIGATGARILVTLVHEMQKRNSKRGLVTLCIGGGQALALTVERTLD